MRARQQCLLVEFEVPKPNGVYCVDFIGPIPGLPGNASKSLLESLVASYVLQVMSERCKRVEISDVYVTRRQQHKCTWYEVRAATETNPSRNDAPALCAAR
jgi:hypothetical protein